MNQYEARKRLRSIAPRALERVAELLESRSERTALAAAKLVLESAYGPRVSGGAKEMARDAAIDDESHRSMVQQEVETEQLLGNRDGSVSNLVSLILQQDD